MGGGGGLFPLLFLLSRFQKLKDHGLYPLFRTAAADNDPAAKLA
jgi:hypothetical protein